MKVCISVEALYNKFGEDLNDCTIEVSRDLKTNEPTYFDLVNNKYGVVCMDGEEVTVLSESDYDFMFENENGEEIVFFTLTKEELEIATFTK